MTATGSMLEVGGALAGQRAGQVLGGIIAGIFGPEAVPVGVIIGGHLGSIGGRAVGAYVASKMENANEDVEKKTKAGNPADVCATCQPQKDPCAHLRKGKGKGDYRGGAHKEMKNPTGDGKDSHHMPAKDGYPNPSYS